MAFSVGHTRLEQALHVFSTRSPRQLFLCLLVVSCVVYLRSPHTNFIFDEQEALLKNPFLRSDAGLSGAFFVDFWGRDPSHTIGSYRPLPVLCWKLLAPVLRFHSPLWFTFINLIAHSLCGVLLAQVIHAVLSLSHEQAKSVSSAPGNVCALLFVAHGLVSEAVCSAVGLADIFVGLFTLLGLLFLLHLPGMFANAKDALSVSLFIVLGCALWCINLLLGLWSKETMLGSMLALVVLAPVLCALGLSRVACGETKSIVFGKLTTNQARLLALCFGSAMILVLTIGSLVAYVATRKMWFPTTGEPTAPWVQSASLQAFFEWFAAPPLPADPLNNPLLSAVSPFRFPTACGLFFKQLMQMIGPFRLVGDYAYPRELPHGWVMSAWLGLVIFVSIAGLGLVLCTKGVISYLLARRCLRAELHLVALGCIILCVCYLPISNAFVLLPTIRAERLLYVPMLGMTLMCAGAVLALERYVALTSWGRPLFFSYLFLVASLGRAHAFDYNDDVSFWRATSQGHPASAKSYLNLGIMLGARGDLDARERLTRRALELAPEWNMAHIYLADVFCRKNQMNQAKPYYFSGLMRASQSRPLVALALQCIWDHGAYSSYRQELERLAEGAPKSWLSYLLAELNENGAENAGIPQKYRPDGYNRVH